MSKTILSMIVLSVSLFLLTNCKDNPSKYNTQLVPSKLVVTMKYSGPLFDSTAHDFNLPTDHVIWIQDSLNRHVKTLNVSYGAVSVGTRGTHISHLPTFRDVINYTFPTDTGLPARFDGITSASACYSTGIKEDTTIFFAWDFTDSSGARVAPGLYHYCAEAANIRKPSRTPPATFDVLNEETSGSVRLLREMFTVDSSKISDSLIIQADSTKHINLLKAKFVY